jgi:hypothetical protein
LIEQSTTMWLSSRPIWCPTQGSISCFHPIHQWSSLRKPTTSFSLSEITNRRPTKSNFLKNKKLGAQARLWTPRSAQIRPGPPRRSA